MHIGVFSDLHLAFGFPDDAAGEQVGVDHFDPVEHVSACEFDQIGFDRFSKVLGERREERIDLPAAASRAMARWDAVYGD